MLEWLERVVIRSSLGDEGQGKLDSTRRPAVTGCLEAETGLTDRPSPHSGAICAHPVALLLCPHLVVAQLSHSNATLPAFTVTLWLLLTMLATEPGEWRL